jgi:hypothetical protein
MKRIYVLPKNTIFLLLILISVRGWVNLLMQPFLSCICIQSVARSMNSNWYFSGKASFYLTGT